MIVKVAQNKSIAARLMSQRSFTTKIAATILQSNHVYKGGYATIAELLQVTAMTGDYADCYETNSRWTFYDNTWQDTHSSIPSDSRYLRITDASNIPKVNAVVKYTADGNIVVNAPTDDSHAATKFYVDKAISALSIRMTNVEDAIENPQLVITKI